jgi:hypothetical protein
MKTLNDVQVGDAEIIIALTQKVMQWKVTNPGPHPRGHLFSYELKTPEGKTLYCRDGMGSLPGSCWNPLESIADAWMIVERMYELGWTWEISRTANPKCVFYSDREPFVACSFAESAPRAICLAALKAVGL